MTLYKLIEIIKNISLKHPNVGSVNEGDIYTINSSPSVKYANVTITQNSHSQDSTYDHYGLTLFYTDRLVDDMESNRLQIQSTGKQMLSNIINYICDEFDVECDNISFQPFTQRFTDECAGVYATITVDVIKETLCAEEYWDESWTAPIITIRNENKKVQFTENGVYTIEYNEENYTGLGKVEVEVNLDLDSVRNEGYQEGYQNGYDVGIESSYSVGYEDGYDKGNEDGYASGYDKGNEDGFANAETVIAEEAQVIEVNRNGYYLSKYADDVYVYPDIVTGDFGDGNYFYNWGEIKDGCFNTEIIPNENTRFEFWWKPTTPNGANGPILLANDRFMIRYNSTETKRLHIQFGDNYTRIDIDASIWQHFVFENGILYINNVQVADFSGYNIASYYDTPILINGNPSDLNVNANGLFGMVKINDSIFIPKDGGFINYRTEEQLGGYVKPSNGTYEYVESDQITGYFDDGTPFYGSAELYNAVFYTDIIGAADSSFEVWWKDKNNSVNDYAAIIGVKQDSSSVLFKIVKRNTGLFRSEYGSDIFSGLDTYEFSYNMSNWTHIKFSKKDGLIVNGELLHSVADKYSIINTPNNKFHINEVEDGRYANGVFGMVKINGQIFIPTEIGFMDYSNNTYLPANISNGKPQFVGEYYFTENQITVIKGEGNFIKSVTVNIQPRINVQKEGLKFAYSPLTEIPEWADWEGITDMSNMFINCGQLKRIPLIDTSNVKTFSHTFNDSGVNEIALLNTSNGTNFEYCFCGSKIIELPQFDLRQGVNFYEFCYNCYDLKYVPNLDLSSATNINGLLENCNSLISVGEIKVPNVRGGVTYFFGGNNKNNLTDFGGLIGFRGSITSDGFHTCPNLSYQSCINILNGLYDFVGNGETPASNEATLKVHQNFLNLVGDEISIGTDKGWTITA